MARKTKKEKIQASTRAQHAHMSLSGTSSDRVSHVRNIQYKETDYDKQLRMYTVKDTVKTIVIIISLFVVQYLIAVKYS